MVSTFEPEVGGCWHDDVDRAILRNKDTILDEANRFDVDPIVLAGCIYVEQRYNYDFIDILTDVPLAFIDTSVGVAQVKISTVILLEDHGYIEPTGSGFTKNWSIAQRLHNDDAYSIKCAAAYLAYLEQRWDGAYDVSQDPSIWGTLYNIGERTPHGNPKPNWFGNKVAVTYSYINRLLGLGN